jgi:hypothetical protein
MQEVRWSKGKYKAGEEGKRICSKRAGILIGVIGKTPGDQRASPAGSRGRCQEVGTTCKKLFRGQNGGEAGDSSKYRTGQTEGRPFPGHGLQEG